MTTKKKEKKRLYLEKIGYVILYTVIFFNLDHWKYYKLVQYVFYVCIVGIGTYLVQRIDS